MRIMYDYQILMNQKYGGISRYFFQLKSGMEKNNIDTVLPISLSQNYYFSNYCKPNIHKATRFYGLINCIKTLLVYCKNEFSGKKIDIIHPTYFYPPYYSFLPIWKRNKSKLVITVHDLIYEKFHPEFEKYDFGRRKRIIEKCDGIITVSENTKKDLLEIYPSVNPNKIVVIYHGIDLDSFSKTEFIEVPAKYVLFVGSRADYKNAKKFINGMSKIINENEDIFIIFAGGGNFSDEESASLKSLGIFDNTLQINPSDEQLNFLYKNAICFVFPSLYEGFGIPIIEAFANGCPVLLHDGSCFPEIAGDAALYFNGEIEEDIYEKVSYIIHDSNLRNELIKNGFMKVKEYTLENTIEKTIAFYENLIR